MNTLYVAKVVKFVSCFFVVCLCGCPYAHDMPLMSPFFPILVISVMIGQVCVPPLRYFFHVKDWRYIFHVSVAFIFCSLLHLLPKSFKPYLRDSYNVHAWITSSTVFFFSTYMVIFLISLIWRFTAPYSYGTCPPAMFVIRLLRRFINPVERRTYGVSYSSSSLSLTSSKKSLLLLASSSSTASSTSTCVSMFLSSSIITSKMI